MEGCGWTHQPGSMQQHWASSCACMAALLDKVNLWGKTVLLLVTFTHTDIHTLVPHSLPPPTHTALDEGRSGGQAGVILHLHGDAGRWPGDHHPHLAALRECHRGGIVRSVAPPYL